MAFFLLLDFANGKILLQRKKASAAKTLFGALRKLLQQDVARGFVRLWQNCLARMAASESRRKRILYASNLTVKVIRSSRLRLLLAGYRTWERLVKVLNERWRAERKMVEVLARLGKKKLASGFYLLRQQADTCRAEADTLRADELLLANLRVDKSRTLKGYVLRGMMGRVGEGFGRWVAAVEMERGKEVEEALWESAQREKENARLASRLGKMKRSILQLTKRALSSAFKAWLGSVAEARRDEEKTRQRREAMRRTVLHLLKRSLSAGFRAWIKQVSEGRKRETEEMLRKQVRQ